MPNNWSVNITVSKSVIHACAEAAKICDSNKKSVFNATLFTAPSFHRNTSSGFGIKKEKTRVFARESVNLLCELERLTFRTFHE